jgi:hypothetical protein
MDKGRKLSASLPHRPRAGEKEIEGEKARSAAHRRGKERGTWSPEHSRRRWPPVMVDRLERVRNTKN